MSLMTTISYARDQINIVGSSTVYPFSTVVAERFGKSGTFKTPVIESTGTGGGMKLFCKGIGVQTPDMSNASRKIKPKEVNLCKQNGVTDITQVIVGLDGIAFTSSVKGKQYNFTKEQLWQAMSDLGSKPTITSVISVTPLSLQSLISFAFIFLLAFDISGVFTPMPLQNSFIPPPVPVDSITGVLNLPDLPNLSATTVEKG